MRLSALSFGIALLVSSVTGRADVPVRMLRSSAIDPARGRSLPAVVRLTDARARLPRGAGVLPIASGFGVISAPLADLGRLADAHPDWAMSWAPPRRFLLERAARGVGAVAVRNATGLTGRGVAIGVVDTGIDPTHGDFRNADGTTRIRWLVDLGAPPLGLHPEAEELCDAAGLPCAVFGRADLDERLANGSSVPGDALGHGTHVASLAAGNGLSGDPARFVGVAPEASLVVARASSAGLGISDVEVLAASEILYWLVEEYGPTLGVPPMPMVLNLSLGSDIGPHDGTSVLGSGLAAIASEHPGRVVVVAAGNSGGLYTGLTTYPEPLGVHTSVHVVEGPERVPIVMPASHTGPVLIAAEVTIWIEMQPGDALSVGFDRADGSFLSPVPPGAAHARQTAELEAVIINAARDELPFLPAGRPAALVQVSGQWPAGETFALRLSGRGTADIWVSAAGALGPETGSLGALVPAATSEGTVNVPAAHPELISVGATLNRLSWTDRDGDRVVVSTGSDRATAADSTVYFTSAGPNVDGAVKPEIVAPGAFVIGAMSVDADPFESPLSVFREAACSPAPACAVVDDHHAVISGSSMAAPLVAGAVALLLEQEPTLTHREVRRLLLAGARPLSGTVELEQQVGAGSLDLERTLAALQEHEAPSGNAPGTGTRIVVGSSYVEPGGTRPLRGFVQVRDRAGAPVDGFDRDRLRLDAEPRATELTFERDGAGLYRFAARAPEASAGQTLVLRVTFGDRVIAQASVPIAVDPSVARHGFLARGGCELSSGARPAPPAAFVTILLVALGRRARRVAHRGSRRDRSARSD